MHHTEPRSLLHQVENMSGSVTVTNTVFHSVTMVTDYQRDTWRMLPKVEEKK